MSFSFSLQSKTSCNHDFSNYLLSGFVLIFLLSTHSSVNAAVLEEVVVTAQKREQNLQDVPISVTAFSGDVIDELGFQKPQDIFQQIPNVSFGEDGGLPQFNIRGVQLYDFGNGNEPPVGVYVDEVYMGTLGSHIGELYDTERIEVLRGPQGTLFGRNTTGGLAHFISRKPTEEFEAHGSIQYGSYDQVIVDGAVSGPLSDRVRGRVAFKYNRDDGWQKNQFNGHRFAVKDIFSIRAQLEIDFTNNLTGLFNIHGANVANEAKHIGMRGILDPITFAPCSVEKTKSGSCVSAVGSPSTPDPKRPITENPSLDQSVDTIGGFAKFSWDLNDKISLTSITAYEVTDRFYTQDADGSTAPLPPNNLNTVTGGFVPLALPSFFNSNQVEAEQFTQELRLSGQNDRFNWVAGGFYFYDDKDKLDFNNPALTAAVGGTLGIDNEATLDTESWALFGQTDITLSDSIYLTAGVRYTDESKDLSITNDVQNPAFFDHELLETDNVTFRAGINWTPREDMLIYMNVSKGFKSGAFKTTFAAPGQATAADEETLMSYEAGLKATLFGGKLRLQSSVFYNDYEDLQILTVTSQGGLPVQILTNAGDADIYGLEADATLILSDDLEAVIGVGLLDAEINSNDALFDGNEPARAPGFTANGVIRYRTPLNLFDGSTSIQTSFTFLGDHFLTPENQPFLEEDAYVLWNARVRWVSNDERYYVEGFVDNIMDETYAIGAFNVGDFAFSGIFWGTPRMGGVKAGFNWN